MADTTQERVDAYVSAYGAWCHAATHHWTIAQRKLEGKAVDAAEVMAVVDEFERTHRQLITLTDRL